VFRKIKDYTPAITVLPEIYELKKIIRSFDGTNNNLKQSKWGSANTSQARHCKANYQDKISVPVQGLPSPRNVSD
jgi:hypothetical protein